MVFIIATQFYSSHCMISFKHMMKNTRLTLLFWILTEGCYINSNIMESLTTYWARSKPSLQTLRLQIVIETSNKVRSSPRNSTLPYTLPIIHQPPTLECQVQRQYSYSFDDCLRFRSVEYVRVFKSLFMTDVNVLYTYDVYQFEALRICRQMLLSAQKSAVPVKCQKWSKMIGLWWKLG